MKEITHFVNTLPSPEDNSTRRKIIIFRIVFQSKVIVKRSKYENHDWQSVLIFTKPKAITKRFRQENKDKCKKLPERCTVVISMFVSSKWQRVVLPTRWRALVRAIFYCYLTFLDHRTNISRKVRAPRHVRASRAPNKFQNCHLDKTNMDKTSQHHLNTGKT